MPENEVVDTPEALVEDMLKLLRDLRHPEQYGHSVPLELRTRARVLEQRILIAVPQHDR